MFCSNCGFKFDGGVKFCPNCGAAVNGQPAPAMEQPKTPAVERMESPNRNGTKNSGQSGKGKKGLPKPLIIVAAVLVLFVGFGAVLSLFEDDDKSEPGESQTTQNTNTPYRELDVEEMLLENDLIGELRTLTESRRTIM